MNAKTKKTLIGLAVFIIAILIVIAVFFQTFLNWATREAIKYLAENLARDGIELQEPEFKGVGPSWFNAITVRGFSAYFMMTQHNVFQIERNFELTVDKVTVSIADLFKREFMLSIKGGLITMQPEYGKTYAQNNLKKDERDKFVIQEMKVRVKLDFLKPQDALAQVQAMTKSVAQFAKYGRTKLPVSFSGMSVFVIRDKPAQARLYTDIEGEEHVLLMNKDDYRMMCDYLGERLTEAELDLYAHNPLRIPRLTRIRNYASEKGREAQAKLGLSQDTVKHVYWAYHLTLAYDDKFSEKITDSHEIGVIGRSEVDVREYLTQEDNRLMDKKEQAPKRQEEVQMDLINNLIGREYAKRNYPESTLIDRMKKDERTVWHWMDLADKKKKKGTTTQEQSGQAAAAMPTAGKTGATSYSGGGSSYSATAY